jgi:hypothetical protein
MLADRITKSIIKGISPMSADIKRSAPLTARIIPRLLHLKKATNCAAKNTNTK